MLQYTNKNTRRVIHISLRENKVVNKKDPHCSGSLLREIIPLHLCIKLTLCQQVNLPSAWLKKRKEQTERAVQKNLLQFITSFHAYCLTLFFVYNVKPHSPDRRGCFFNRPERERLMVPRKVRNERTLGWFKSTFTTAWNQRTRASFDPVAHAKLLNLAPP